MTANPSSEGVTAEKLVDDLIAKARSVEWEAHFGSLWDARREEMLEARSKVLRSIEQLQANPQGVEK